MSSSSPLNRHPEDAVAGHDARSGAGMLQRPTRAQPGEQPLIERGYVPVRQITGKVVAIWGDAQIRHLDGTVTPLHVGDVVRKGEVVLTAQDGIVQLEAHPARFAAADDVERAISQVANSDADAVPAAGPNAGGAAGSLEEGLRVGRDAESITPAALEVNAVAAPTAAPQAQAVAPLQTGPVANPDTERTGAGTPVAFDPRANDTSSSGLTIVAVAGHPIGPATPVTLPQGTVSMNADGSLTFTPNHGFDGSLSFTYTDANGNGQTSTSSVTIEVAAPVDHQPVAAGDTFSGIEDKAISGSLAGNDAPSADGGNVWALASRAAHGSVTVNADGTFSYVPAAHYSGPDSFTYTITDIDGSSSSATVTLAVAPVPLAAADTVTVGENTPASGTLAANDTASADGSSVWTLATGAAHGSVTVNADGTYTYVPAAGFHGTDSFTYTITDAAGSTSTAGVTLTVTPATPVAAPDVVDAQENAPVAGTLAGNDTPVAGESNTWAIATGPQHGTVALDPDGRFVYTPATGYNGPDSFTYTITDGAGQASTAAVNLTVAALLPTAGHGTVSLPENGSVAGSVAWGDVGVAGETSTWSVAAGPANGTLAFNPDGSYIYTPNAGYNGADKFTYTLTDATGHTSTATVDLTIRAQLPITSDDFANVTENGAISGSVAGNDTGVAHEASTWFVAAGPANGTLVFNTDGSYNYTPNAGYNGADTFTYTLTDSTGHTSTATVNLTVTALVPTAGDDTAVVAENGTITGSVTGNDAGVAHETSTWSLAAGPANGTLIFNADGSYTYTPNAGYNGADKFSYSLTDSTGHTSTATVDLTIAALQPAASNDAATVVENGSVTASVAGDDAGVAGETSTWSVASGPANGTLAFNRDGSYTYSPNPGYNGADKFTYTLTDSTGHTSTAAVSLTVTALLPLAGDDIATVAENGSITGSVAGNDVGVANEASTWSLAAGPAHGTLVFNPDGSYTYTPTPGYSGADKFTYALTDSTGHASTATVDIGVTGLAPIAQDDSATVTENGIVSGSVAANDVGVTHETSSWTLGAGPAHGSLVFNADGSYTYTPTPGYNGADSFTYTLVESGGATSTATVKLTVTPLIPSAADDVAVVTENASISGSVAGNDVGVAHEASTWSLAAGPANGTLVFDPDGSYTYTPSRGYNGTDSFTYTLTDSTGHTSTATVNLTVTALQPTAGNDTATVVENSSLTASVTGNDTGVAGETSTWAVATNPAHGTVTMAANGSYTYTPAAGFNGTDSFTYTLTDSTGHTSTATVNLIVTALQPTAGNDTATVVENGSVTASVTANDAGVAGETSTWAVTTNPAHGTVTMAANGSYTYTPAAGFNGTDSFTYTLTDSTGHTSTATVNLTVTALQPTATNDTATVVENGSLTASVTGNDIGVTGETSTWAVATNPAHGTVTMAANGSYTYTPAAGFNGTDSFTYTLTDSTGHTSTATVNLTVTALQPTATNDTATVVENGSLTASVTGNDIGVTGETSTWAVATNPAHGTVTMAANGSYTYTPATGYNGTDSFTYTLTDSTGHASTATVTLTVNPLSPTAASDAFTVTANGATPTLSVRTNDTPVAGETNAWSVKTNPAHGTLAPAADFASTGNFTYTPTAGYTGSDSFTYLITDGSGHAATATVTITVVADTAPVAVSDTYNATENTLLVLNGAAGTSNHALTTNDTDANGDALTVTQINGTAIAAGGSVVVSSGGVTEGTVTMDANGVIAFNPTTNYTGNATLAYTISDGHGGTSTANVSITVAAGTDDPSVSANSVGRWLFNENSGTSTKDAYDNYTGTLTDLVTSAGGTAPTWITGHNGTAGSALSFDGKGGIVSVPLADTAALTGTSSLSVWFNTTQVGSSIGWSSPSIIGSEHTGDANDIQWGTINNKGQIGLGLGNDANGVYSTAAVNDGNWHDLTITRSVNADGTSAVSVFVDGVLSNSATLAAQSQITNGTPFNELAGFGYTNAWSGTAAAPTDSTTGDVFYKGALDDARIYNHVLTADQAKAIYNVENGYETQAVANDGDAIKLAVTDTHATALHVIGVENRMTLSDGTHTITSTGNTQVIDVTGWTLNALQLTNVGTGSATLEFDAVNTNASTGQSEDTSTYLSVVNGTSLLGGTSGDDTLAAGSANATFISGGAGNDSITGGAGDDRLLGGAGNDTISGGAGNDLIVGGTGSDTLTGGTGNDVFRWELGDHGTAGTPNVDTITDFSSAAGNKDVLDLRDLLGGANHNGSDPGNIASFLHFDHSGADTIIHVSSTGGFASGYSSGSEDETIVLKNVDLTAAGSNNDSQIIHQLLANGQLHLG